MELRDAPQFRRPRIDSGIGRNVEPDLWSLRRSRPCPPEAAVRDEQEHKDRPFSPASKLDTLSDHQKEEVESQSRPNAA